MQVAHDHFEVINMLDGNALDAIVVSKYNPDYIVP